MAVRPEERLCADALQRFLQDKHGIASLWTGVDNDPPDLRFEVTRSGGMNESWAVEVTGLVQRFHQEGKKNGGNRYDFGPRIMKMVQRLNAELGPMMRFGYYLNVTGPLDPNVFRDLERRVREYIEMGKTTEEALDWMEAVNSVRKEITTDVNQLGVREVIERVATDRVKVTMKAVDGNGIVAFSGISGAARVPNSRLLAADVDATLDASATYILHEKIPRMATVEGYKRKVLLIWSAIPMVSATDVGAVFASKVKAGLDGIFLYHYGKNRVTLILDRGLLA